MTETFGQLLIERRGETAWVTINRASERNSINSALMADIVGLIDRLEAEGARAAVFRGAGDTYFIGGADGLEMMHLSPEEAHAFSGRIQNLFNRLESSSLITAAAINGLCFGGGYELALACDLRVADPSARIGLPEVKVGLIPGGGGTQRLPRLIGLGRALELILSGRLVKAEEAERLGLIHLAVGEGELEEGVNRLLEPILKQAPYATALAKRAVYASADGDLRHGLGVESKRFSRCFERTFFSELMERQIREGLLRAGEDVPDAKGEKGA